MKGGIGQILKQAQKMQADLERAQAELAELRLTGESGGGMVKVTMNGKHEVIEVTIDEQMIGDDREMLEDLIAAACNDAVRKVAVASQERMSGLAGGLNLPEGMKLPF